MKIEVQKLEKLNGQVWYYVYAGNECLEAFMVVDTAPDKALQDAYNLYEKMIQRLKDGFPKTETVLYFDSDAAK